MEQAEIEPFREMLDRLNQEFEAYHYRTIFCKNDQKAF